jgi:hypothetical protein
MKKDYLKIYADQFDLNCVDGNYYDSNKKLLLSLTNEAKYLNYKNEKGDWRIMKTSDLALNIIENIPLHKLER